MKHGRGQIRRRPKICEKTGHFTGRLDCFRLQRSCLAAGFTRSTVHAAEVNVFVCEDIGKPQKVTIYTC